MNILIIAALITGIAFYLIIPGGGAFYVRRRWRVFRQKIISSTRLPQVSYARLKGAPEGFIGEYRMLGALQAIQGDDEIWVSNESISLRVQLSGVDIYTLPHSTLAGKGRNISIRENLTDDIPVRMPWSRFSSISEGTRLFISGSLYRENGQLMFKSSRENPLLVLIYDGAEDTILLRTIWAGRQRNEYINDFTPSSMAAGGVLILLFTYLSVRQVGGDFSSWLIFTMAISPLLVMLPPGLLFFELYRYFWRRGRRFRAERDLVLLSLRYWPSAQTLSDCADILLPGGQYYGFRAFESAGMAVEKVKKGRLVNTNGCHNDNELPDCGANVFGVVGTQDEDDMFPPAKDLLISPLIIPGDPCFLHKNCSGKARIMEILAGLSITTGFVVNLFLFFLILLYIVT